RLFFLSSRRRHTRSKRDWSSDVCSSDLVDDAGLDLTSAEDLEIPAGGRALIDTGISLALPPGTVGLVCPRSGLAAEHGITVLNEIGRASCRERGERAGVAGASKPRETGT